MTVAGMNILQLCYVITITAQDENGNNRQTRHQCYDYVSERISTLYLSEQACEDLGILLEDWKPGLPWYSHKSLLMPGKINTSTTPQHHCLHQPQQKTERS